MVGGQLSGLSMLGRMLSVQCNAPVTAKLPLVRHVAKQLERANTHATN